MALVKCPECGKEVSDTARNCVHCGYKNQEKKYNKIGGWLVFVMIGYFIAILNNIDLIREISGLYSSGVMTNFNDSFLKFVIDYGLN